MSYRLYLFDAQGEVRGFFDFDRKHRVQEEPATEWSVDLRTWSGLPGAGPAEGATIATGATEREVQRRGEAAVLQSCPEGWTLGGGWIGLVTLAPLTAGGPA